MKSFQVVSFFCASSLLVLSACSGGGGGLLSGGRDMCAKNFSLAPNVLRKGEVELDLDPSAKQLIPGEYTYNGADLYYVDSQNDLRVLVSDVKQIDPTMFKTTVECYRNAYPGMAGISFQSQGVSGMRVEADGKVLIETRSFDLVVAKGIVTGHFNKSSGDVPKAPKEIFDDPSNPSHGQLVHLIKTSPTTATDFELRTTGVTARGTYDLIIRLQRRDLAAPTPTP